MKYKFIDSVIGFLFVALVIGTAFMQTELKSKPQFFMLLFGLLTLGFLLAKQPFKSSIPFFVLLGSMIYVSTFILTNQIVNLISPDNGWIIGSNGEKYRVMSMNWIWGAITGLVLSPVAVLMYHKKVRRNRLLEISLTTIFIITTAIIYIK